MSERIYVALDVETTGLIAGVDELIEVAAVKFRGAEILEQYSQLVCPRQDLPLKITRLTGITPEDVAAAPRFNQIGADVARFIKSYPIVGHSVGFDLTMLRAQGMNFAQPAYDTFELATLLMPQRRSISSAHSPPASASPTPMPIVRSTTLWSPRTSSTTCSA